MRFGYDLQAFLPRFILYIIINYGWWKGTFSKIILICSWSVLPACLSDFSTHSIFNVCRYQSYWKKKFPAFAMLDAFSFFLFCGHRSIECLFFIIKMYKKSFCAGCSHFDHTFSIFFCVFVVLI